MISLDSLAELHEWCATYWPKADAVQVINTYSEHAWVYLYALQPLLLALQVVASALLRLDNPKISLPARYAIITGF